MDKKLDDAIRFENERTTSSKKDRDRPVMTLTNPN
jgi:hypothetical protein